jgi:MFS family permease
LVRSHPRQTTAAVPAGNLPVLLFCRAAVGLGEGVSMPCIQNLVACNVPHSKKPRSLALVYSGVQVHNFFPSFSFWGLCPAMFVCPAAFVWFLFSPVYSATPSWRRLKLLKLYCFFFSSRGRKVIGRGTMLQG